MPFTQINPALSRALALKGYTTPTPVQQSVLEKGLNGQDLLEKRELMGWPWPQPY